MNSTTEYKTDKLDVRDTFETGGTTLSSVIQNTAYETSSSKVISPRPTFNNVQTSFDNITSTFSKGINMTDEEITTHELGLSNEPSINGSSIYFASTEVTAQYLDNYTTNFDDNNSTSTDLGQLILNNLWIPLATSLFLIIVAGILLNSATLFMFYRTKLPRSGANQLILNFTCSDLLVTAVAYPVLLLALVVGSWPFGLTGCKVYLYVFFLLGSASNNSRTAIAVDR